VFVSPWHDNHDVSRMWLADVIRRVPVKGDPVAFLPGRDHLVVAGADDEPGLAAAAAFVRSLIEEETRFMTGYPFRLRGDRWERFRAPDGHPAGEALQLLTCHTLSFDHRQQKELLDAIHEKQGDDTFVTDLMVVRKDGVLGTVASWGEGCRALLPRADQVGLSSAAVTKIASWDHVQAVAGDLLEPTDLYPARYRTLGFPSPEQLAKL